MQISQHQTIQCEVDWSIHKVWVKHSRKAIIINWAYNQQFKKVFESIGNQQTVQASMSVQWSTQVRIFSSTTSTTSEPDFKVSKAAQRHTFNCSKFLPIWFYHQLATWWTLAKQLLLTFKWIFNMHMKRLSSTGVTTTEKWVARDACCFQVFDQSRESWSFDFIHPTSFKC